MDSDSSPSIEVSVGHGAWRTTVTDPEAFVRHVAIAALRQSSEAGPIPKSGVPDQGLKPLSGVIADLRFTPIEVSIRLTDDAEVRELNRVYRGQDKPTNVLSFPGDGSLPSDEMTATWAAGQPVLLGDVVVALETTIAEAVGMDRPVDAHLAHLIVHGVLHLLGHDHLDDGEAGRMEALETCVLAGLGYRDPYAEDHDATNVAPNAAAASQECLSEALP
jgi:probable rRNA maturation factor